MREGEPPVETDLGAVRLPEGAVLERIVVDGPDVGWKPRLLALLGHKAPVYLGHVHASLDGPLEGLATSFAVGLVSGVPVTVAMVAGAEGAGILGHVYTVPDWRRRGAATALFSALLPLCDARGYRVLTLGTSPDGHARRLYEAFGFRALTPTDGSMLRGDGTPPQGASSVGPLRWSDWGWISAAACAPPGPEEPMPRSRCLRVGSPGHVENALIAARRDAVPIQVVRRGPAAVGWACRPAAGEAEGALDLYVRPGQEDLAQRLVAALNIPPRQWVRCAVGTYRSRALEAAGFQPVAAGVWSGPGDGGTV